jgi:hypothetical protein
VVYWLAIGKAEWKFRSRGWAMKRPYVAICFLLSTMAFAQIEVSDGTKSLVVDKTQETDVAYDAIVHLGTDYPADPSRDKTFSIACLKKYAGFEGDCGDLYTGTGFTIVRIPNTDKRAYPVDDKYNLGSVIVTFSIQGTVYNYTYYIRHE